MIVGDTQQTLLAKLLEVEGRTDGRRAGGRSRHHAQRGEAASDRPGTIWICAAHLVEERRAAALSVHAHRKRHRSISKALFMVLSRHVREPAQEDRRVEVRRLHVRTWRRHVGGRDSAAGGQDPGRACRRDRQDHERDRVRCARDFTGQGREASPHRMQELRISRSIEGLHRGVPVRSRFPVRA